MKVRANSVRSLRSLMFRDHEGTPVAGDHALTVGAEFTVYAMLIDATETFYYIVNDDDHPWPLWHPSSLFELVDRRVSCDWVYAPQDPIDTEVVARAEGSAALFAFPEWVDQPDFLERLTDNLEPEVSVFSRYKRRMDAESEGWG